MVWYYQRKVPSPKTECFSNIRLVKNFSTEDKELKKLIRQKHQMYIYGIRFQDLRMLLRFYGKFKGTLFQLCISYYLGNLYMDGKIKMSVAMVLTRHAGKITQIVTKISNRFTKIREQAVELMEVFDLLNEEPTIKPDEAEVVTNMKGAVEFKNLSFYY